VRTDIRGSSKLRIWSLGASLIERAFDTLLGVLKRLGKAGDIGQDGIGDWERLVEILCEFAIDVMGAGNALFLEGGLTIGGEMVTFLLTCVEAASCGREVFIGLGVE